MAQVVWSGEAFPNKSTYSPGDSIGVTLTNHTDSEITFRACGFAPDLGKRGSAQPGIFLREGSDPDSPQVHQSGMVASLGSLKRGTFVSVRLQDRQMFAGPIAEVYWDICRFDDVQDTAVDVSAARDGR